MRNALSLALILLTFFGCRQTATEEAVSYDICIYGGTSAGVIAAHAAKKLGHSVLLIEPGEHLGGMSASGLGSTDIGNKHAVVGLSRDFYRRLGDHYGKFEAWTFEPSVAERTFEEYIKEADVEVLRNHRLASVEKEGAQIQGITVEQSDAPEKQRKITAKMFIDCTYEGDLMAMAGVSYTVGRESNDKYGETLNGVQLRKKHQFEDGIDPYVVKGDPSSGLLWGISEEPPAPNGTGNNKVQAYNFRMCWSTDPENQVPFSETKPENYDPEHYALLLRLMEEREAAGWENHNANDYFIIIDMPNNKTDVNNRGAFSTDYIGGNYEYPDGDYQKRAEIWADHENYTKGLLYFMAADERVPARVQDHLNQWGWAKDEFIDNNHFPHQLYVREARRLVGETVMTEHHCLANEVVDDPIGLAAYTMDSHNCDRVVIQKDGQDMVKNEGNVEVGGFPPFPIAYSALTPKREECQNLLVPVCLSASHIAYGSIRMEPVFMVMGQVAAIAASRALKEGKAVQEVSHQAIAESIGTDPLLDGTRPDILVDNADTAYVELSGSWQDTSRWMGQYKADYLMARAEKGPPLQLTFRLPVEEAGKYAVYYYSPRRPGGLGEEWERELPLLLRHQGGSTELTADLQAHERDWVELGEYTFAPGETSSLTVLGGQAEGYIAADAVLLVPVVN